ncbi:MAG TPA: hypothetical protein VM432_12995 [Bdellovibrionales bacterium]|nr:hypothetical protein [Bdellovibrionales bacterium]
MRLNPAVLYKEAGDEIHVINVNSHQGLLRIDGIACDLFKSINGEQSLRAIVDQLVVEHEVKSADRRKFEAESKKFASDLVAAEIAFAV